MGRIIVYCLLFTVYFLAGCANPQAVQPVTIYVSPAPVGDLVGDAAAQATQGARAAQDAQATYQAETYKATSTAAVATATALSATQQAQTIATQTAVAATGTAESLIVQATQQALNVQATQQAQAINLGGTATVWAMSGTATADAQRVENVALLQQAEATRMAYEAEQQRIALQRAETWNAVWPWLLAGVFALLAVGAVTGMVFVWRNKRPYYAIPAETPRMLVADGRNGWRVLAAPPALPQLPPPSVANNDVNTSIPTPRWEAFMAWDDPLKIPIGINVRTGKPIFIDRNKEPHLLIPGTTGTGKTSSGLVPFITAMVGAGLHAILVNGRGADFAAFHSQTNITILPRVEREARPLLLAGVLEALVKEIDRRDHVLERAGVTSWHQLSVQAGEAGEFVVVVDEFLAMIEAAKEQDRHMANRMWSALVNLSSEARKFGIYLALTATDPTERALGGRGMTIRSQMARIVFGMKDADASRKILGSIQGFPNGSVGLPTGQFVSNIMGNVEHGVAFHPSADDVRRYLAAREVRPNPLPDVVLNATQLPSGVWSAGVLPVTQAEIDGKALDGRVSQCTSLRAVGELLYGLEPGGSVSGDMIDTRITPALEWRLKHKNCPDALRLLNKSGKWVAANNGRLAVGVSA